jgi:putative transposase
MGISRSAYYDAPVMALDDTAIVEALSAIRDEFEHYGWRRVQAALRQQGFVVNHKKVKRLMREHDLQPRMRGDMWRQRTATTTIRPSEIW